MLRPARLKSCSRLLAAALSFAAGLTAGARPAGAVPPSVFHEQILQPGDRRVTVAVPARYDGAEPVPLVVVLHFAGAVTPFFGRHMLAELAEPALRNLGAVMIAPDCTDADWTGPDSEATVLAATDWAKRTYRIDPARTLLTGYSMGAMGTWYLAARHQDIFRAALIVSGLPLTRAAEVEWRIPLYVIHSRDDGLLLLKPTADVVAQLRAKGANAQLVVVDGLTHYRVSGFIPYLRAAIPWVRRAWQ